MTQAAPSSGLVTVFGGSGFLGRHVVRALAQRGWRVRVAVRRPDLAGHVQPQGIVGQIHPVQANLRFPDSVRRALEGADAAVNLVGILYETSRQSFTSLHEKGARSIAQASREQGARAFVQVSALGASAGSDSSYARSKAAGERAVLEERPDATILRPSIVFGPEDNFFNQFAAMARVAPALPLIGGGHTRFQPVYVGDVAEAIVRSIEGKARPGVPYELGGPEVRSFRELLEFILKTIHRRRPLVTLPFVVAEIQGRIFELLPKPLLTYDQVQLLRQDNVVSEEAVKAGRTLQGLGIEPASIEAIVPAYLYRFRKTGQFDRARPTE